MQCHGLFATAVCRHDRVHSRLKGASSFFRRLALGSDLEHFLFRNEPGIRRAFFRSRSFFDLAKIGQKKLFPEPLAVLDLIRPVRGLASPEGRVDRRQSHQLKFDGRSD